MIDTFDAEAYWIDRGRRYIHEARLSEDFAVHQAEWIANIVSDRRPASILELGCGYGRVTREIARRLPAVSILGIDLSEDQIRESKSYCTFSNVEFRRGNISDALPAGPFDLVIGIEFFLHLPPELLADLIPRIFNVTHTLLHDFDREHPRLPLSPHVWAHHYPVLYRDLGLTYEVLESGPYSLMKVTQ